MSCIPSDPRFRLLDHLVGWDKGSAKNLTGFDDPDGVRLSGSADELSAMYLDPFIPPPRLSQGCHPCDWYLITKPAPDSLLLRLDGCSNTWRAAWDNTCTPVEFDDAVAVAVDRHRIAVADRGNDAVWIFLLKGAQVIGKATVVEPVDISFGPRGALTVAADDGQALLEIAESGRLIGPWPDVLPPGRIERLSYDLKGRLWLVMESGGRKSLHLQVSSRSSDFRPATLEELSESFSRTALVRSDSTGFCLTRGGPSGAEILICYDWFGREIPAECVGGFIPGSFERQGQLLTLAIDSGLPRCNWHRVHYEADIPVGSAVSLSVSSSEEPLPAAQGVASGSWATFQAGRPHPADWQNLEPGIADALIRQPPGRYLFLRLRLTGDGTVTPRVRRIHIDFPRNTSADLLPAVFRQDPAASDFTERFISLFDASLETVDATVAQFPALLDSERTAEEVLPWIADFLAVTMDESWSTVVRRQMLKEAPSIFRRRGTLGGMKRAIRLAYQPSIEPAIVEHGLHRAWGAVGSASNGLPAVARLGDTRLFSKSRTRMTLGTSRIGVAPVMSYGDPSADAHATGAFRFDVSLPPATAGGPRSLNRLIEGLKPAHTIAGIRMGGESGFLLGSRLQLGIDTLIKRPVPKALGDPNLRLSRGAVLGGQPRPNAVLGLNTLSSYHNFKE